MRQHPDGASVARAAVIWAPLIKVRNQDQLYVLVCRGVVHHITLACKPFYNPPARDYSKCTNLG